MGLDSLSSVDLRNSVAKAHVHFPVFFGGIGAVCGGFVVVADLGPISRGHGGLLRGITSYVVPSVPFVRWLVKSAGLHLSSLNEVKEASLEHRCVSRDMCCAVRSCRSF